MVLGTQHKGTHMSDHYVLQTIFTAKCFSSFQYVRMLKSLVKLKTLTLFALEMPSLR